MAAALDPVQAVPVPVRVKNGRLHIRYRVGERTVDDGRCGVDENWTEVSVDQIEQADPDRLCRYCFPGTSGD